MAVTEQTLRLQEQITAEPNRLTAAQDRALVSAWADAWDEVAPDLTAALLELTAGGAAVTRATLVRATRLSKVLLVIADQLEQLVGDAEVRIIGDLRAVVDAAGSAQATLIDSQLPEDSDLVNIQAWTRVENRSLDAIVRRSTEQITSAAAPIDVETHDVVRRELIRGVAAGTNPRATAARIVRRAEQGFNGGLTRALTIARTETLDAHREGARLGQSQLADVLSGWAWLSKLDARTCPSCWAQHGRLHSLDEPGPHDHQQGRCARMPVVKPWADLGFDDIDEPDPAIPDAAARFDALSPERKLQVLGPARYTAWARGDYPMDAWSQLHSTDGWRDSYRVSRAPAGAQSGGRVSLNVA